MNMSHVLCRYIPPSPLSYKISPPQLQSPRREREKGLEGKPKPAFSRHLFLSLPPSMHRAGKEKKTHGFSFLRCAFSPALRGAKGGSDGKKEGKRTRAKKRGGGNRGRGFSYVFMTDRADVARAL